jgi:xylulokinase
MKDGYLLGYDLGSSSIKAALLDVQTGTVIGTATSPATELPILASQPGWAEQHPASWWEHLVKATALLKQQHRDKLADVCAIGLSYQMHGLVVTDKQRQVLRPAIIWCDSRAVAIGHQAFDTIGKEKCLQQLLNSPGNFTASKLKWVKENEPVLYQQIAHFMLPGDYIAMRLTGELKTTPSGLSEAILWDFSNQAPADFVMDYYGFDKDLLPESVPALAIQGRLTSEAAAELGLKAGIPLAYRAGDQPNNALSLNVLEPGELATTAGTSGVIYGITDKPLYDQKSRVNPFLHVNSTPFSPRYGVLLCINGAGALNSWIRNNFFKHNGHYTDYESLNQLALQAPVGAAGLVLLPYGNGAERTLGNRNIGCVCHGLNFNIHSTAHYLRAAQEGIAFAFKFGVEIMQTMGLTVNRAKAGYANMFLSPLFAETFANVLDTQVDLYNTDGSVGAARAAGVGAGIYRDFAEAFAQLQIIRTIEPQPARSCELTKHYQNWKNILLQYL